MLVRQLDPILDVRLTCDLGNVTAKPSDTPVGELMTTPTLKSKMYTTGRGGTGNMAKNDNPEESRAAQDVDVPGILLSEGPRHTGRGKLLWRY